MNTAVRELNLTTLWLWPGDHDAPPAHAIEWHPSERQFDLMEACAYIAGERWSSHPECVSPLLVGWGRMINDFLPSRERQDLKAYIPRLIRTGHDRLGGHLDDRARTWIGAHTLMRRWLPDFLVRGGHHELELRVRDMPPVTSPESSAVVRDQLRAIRMAAWAKAHPVGQAVDTALNVAAEAVMEGMSGPVGYSNTGSRLVEAYWATHIDTDWSEAFDVFEEFLQVNGPS